jgi:vacuolar-type H+-ATPase subunit I/STV1
MKWLLIIVGALLIIVGTGWMLQGTNVLTQGAMAGHVQWTVIGGILAVVGIVLVVLGARRRKAPGA